VDITNIPILATTWANRRARPNQQSTINNQYSAIGNRLSAIFVT
jgi:hypothetical protein